MARKGASTRNYVHDELPLTAAVQPGSASGRRLVSSIAAENAREIVRRLLGQRGRLGGLNAGLFKMFEGWLHRADPPISVCWHSAFSTGLNTLPTRDDRATAHAAIALALHLNTEGEAGSWSANGLSRGCFRWGIWSLPHCETIDVETDGQAATILINGGPHLQLVRTGSQWRSFGKTPGLRHHVTLGGRSIALLTKADADDDKSLSRPAAVHTLSERHATQWQYAADMIRDYAAPYAPWVGRVVRQLLVLEPTPGVAHSGSHPGRYGLIFGSGDTSVASSAEILVHEASHQYFNILRRLGPVDDGSDTILHYSPLVDRGRPLDRILFAFHACANILGFYRACMASGIVEDAFFRRNEPVVIDQLQQLARPLKSNPALTPLGRAFFEPWVELVD
jgi:HEXXH motif-containing protein